MKQQATLCIAPSCALPSPTQVQDIHAWLRTLTGEIPVNYVAEPQLPAKGAF